VIKLKTKQEILKEIEEIKEMKREIMNDPLCGCCNDFADDFNKQLQELYDEFDLLN